MIKVGTPVLFYRGTEPICLHCRLVGGGTYKCEHPTTNCGNEYREPCTTLEWQVCPLNPESLRVAFLIKEITAIQKKVGHNVFWEKNQYFKKNDLTVGEALCMAAGELNGEAMEAYRDNKRLKFAIELADAILRICHIAGDTNVPLVKALIGKLAADKRRPYLHGRENF